MNEKSSFVRLVPFLMAIVMVCLVFTIGSVVFLLTASEKESLPTEVTSFARSSVIENKKTRMWQAPDSTKIPLTPEGNLIRYGRELVAHTSLYLGPSGKIQPISNGMNCQNCHLKSGTKIFGNNYAGVASTYPKFRPRSGTIETIEKRVNDCIERSLNGATLSVNSQEMKAFVAYIKWVGNEVSKGEVVYGTGLVDLPLLSRAADPAKGRLIYLERCARCHGKNGEGLRHPSGGEWKYPPLWGDSSFNTGAGLFRLSRMAGYVKANMPYGTSFDNPELTDEEAWDVSAYITSMPRPIKVFTHDWPDLATKPFDHPFGPYADTFTEMQHKYGPFEPIKKVLKK